MLYVWRKQMGVSYQDMLATPWHVIMQDIDMMSIESKYRKPKIKDNK